MVAETFRHVTSWVFDLDNTLYPPAARLFDQIEVRMTDWVMTVAGVDRPEADRLRLHYWQTYGTTLAGLMAELDVDPAPYLTHVHDIDMQHLEKATELAAHIDALPGRKIVYTNGSAPYAKNVLQARGLDQVFDAVYGVEDAGFRPKPDHGAFRAVFGTDGLDPQRAAMFEDDPRNLKAPHQMGMKTVHVAETPVAEPHIHHHTDDLEHFLAQLIR